MTSSEKIYFRDCATRDQSSFPDSSRLNSKVDTETTFTVHSLMSSSWSNKVLQLPSFNVNKHPSITLCCVILFETCLSYLIIQKIPYTEIDWVAYMQEVRGVIEGDFDYQNLRGDTGPLVYPAGFVYIYSILYYLTDSGTNLVKAQYLFLLLHVSFIYIFTKLLMDNTRRCPLWMVVMTCISRRIHSIFVLRLFNDCFAVFFCYLSLAIFASTRNYYDRGSGGNRSIISWSMGSMMYSFAVSIKMNILLYAPAIGLLYFKYLGFIGTVQQVILCVLTQVLIGFPFLMTYPMSYMTRAFNLSKDFEYKWTVNFKFIDESLFLNKTFGHGLLLLLVVTLLITAHWIWCAKEGGLFRYIYKYWNGMNGVNGEKGLKSSSSSSSSQSSGSTSPSPKGKKKRKGKKKGKGDRKKKEMEKGTMAVVDGEYFLDRLFLCNFMGIVFAKSLHFQFYVWYYHTIPYLAWRSSLPLIGKWVLVMVIEMIWNIFPSNAMSSIALWICHLTLLGAVLHFQYNDNKKKKQP